MKTSHISAIVLMSLLSVSAFADSESDFGQDPLCQKNALSVAKALDLLSSPNSDAKPKAELISMSGPNDEPIRESWNVLYREKNGASSVYSIQFEGTECMLSAVQVFND